MKFIGVKAFIASLTIISMLIATPAIAGQNHHHKNKHKNYNTHNNHSNHQYRESRHHRSHHKSKHIIGGIIGGVILSNIFNNLSQNHQTRTSVRSYNTQYTNYPRYYNSQSYNKQVVVQNTPITTYRVLNGTECYLVNSNQLGHDILTQVPNINCGF